MLKDLAYINGLRGRDGAGILQGTSSSYKKEYKICKTWQEISYLQWFNEWHKDGDRRFLSDIGCNFFAIHCRWATVGANSDENSHPFDFPTLVGMHNGTLDDVKYFHHSKTDSEMMFEDMNRWGIKPVLASLDKKSAYAIVVYDKITGQLHFARNDDRPLFFAYNKKRGVVYWASEVDMLKLAAGRNKIELNDFVYLSPNKVYTVNPDSVRANEWPKWVAEDVFQKGVAKAQSIAPVKKKAVANENRQEDIELARAAAAGEQLVADAKRLRSNVSDVRHTPRILDDSVDSSRLWADVNDLEWNDGIIFDDVKDTPLKAEARGPEDLRFDPTRIPTYNCSFCNDKMSLLDKFYGSVWKGNVVVCHDCLTVHKEMKEGVQTH